MANDIKGITVEIGGNTTPLTNALKEVNDKSDKLGKELSDVNRQLKFDPTNTVLIGQKQEILAERIKVTSQKLNTLKETEKQVQEQFKNGEIGQEQYRAMQREIIKSESQLKTFGEEAAGTNTALAKVSDQTVVTAKNTRSLSDAVKSLASMAGINLPPALQGMVNKLDSISVSGATLAGGIAGAVYQLGKMTIQAAQTADDILTMSSTTGLSTDALQEFNYAAELVDVSTEKMSGSMTKMIRSMNSARDGSGEVADAYKKLGIHVTGSNHQLRDANDVFYEAIDALGRVKNETERDAIAMQIFGKSARDLNPLIETGSARLKELAAQAHELGYVMDEETLEKLGHLDDLMQQFKAATFALRNSLAEWLLPALTSMFDMLSKIPPETMKTIIVIAGIVATTVLATKTIREMSGGIGDAVKGIKDLKKWFNDLSPAALKTTAYILGAVLALIALGGIITVLSGKTGELEKVMTSVGTMSQNVRGQVTAAQTNIPRYAYGTSYHAGGLALVGDGGPELIDLPRGSKVYSNKQSRQMVGGDTFYVTIDAKNVKEFNDIVNMANTARQQRRAGG